MAKKRIIEEQATTDIFNDDWLVKDSVTQGTTKIQPSVFKAWINDGMATEEDIETIVENIADTYSTSESYAEGDLCIHEYALFKCIGATTGTWDSTKWESTTIAEIISTIDLSAEAISYDNASSGLEADNVQDAIDETITKLSAVGSASGDIATFTDGSALPMPSLKVAIEPQQEGSGDPSPTNIRPISGWDVANVNVDGFNQFDDDLLLEASGWSKNNDYYTGTIAALLSKYANGIWVNKGRYTGQFCLSFIGYMSGGSGGRFEFKYTDGTTSSVIFGSTEEQRVVVSTEGKVVEKITINYGSSGVLYLKNLCINISEPSKDGQYIPYNGHTYTIDLDGTRYGGTLDVVSGVLTVIYGIKVYSGNSSEGWYADGTQSGSTYRMKASDVPSNIKLPSSNADAMSAISNQFIAISADNIFLGNEGIGIPTNGSYLTLYSSVYNTNDVSLWKTHLASNPMQVVYELATPQTIQLTPTQVKSLLGVNNVWADCGDVDVSYVRDLTTTINYILEQLNS